MHKFSQNLKRSNNNLRVRILMRIEKGMTYLINKIKNSKMKIKSHHLVHQKNNWFTRKRINLQVLNRQKRKSLLKKQLQRKLHQRKMNQVQNHQVLLSLQSLRNRNKNQKEKLLRRNLKRKSSLVQSHLEKLLKRRRFKRKENPHLLQNQVLKVVKAVKAKAVLRRIERSRSKRRKK